MTKKRSELIWCYICSCALFPYLICFKLKVHCCDLKKSPGSIPGCALLFSIDVERICDYCIYVNLLINSSYFSCNIIFVSLSSSACNTDISNSYINIITCPQVKQYMVADD